MNYSCWAALLLSSFLLLYAAIPTEAESVQLVNGSTNLVLGVWTDQGGGFIQPGQSLSWQAFLTATNFIDGTNAGYWTVQPTHSYTLLLGVDGGLVVEDSAPHSATTFMWGFGTFFVLFLGGWGASWAKRTVDPGDFGE